jgi:protein TonB
MDFARQQRDPTRHMIGIAFVVLFHALIVYALVTGLARKAVEVIKKPLDAKIIEEIKAPPPPPPPKPVQQQQQRIESTPQPYVPPPDIEVPQVTQTAPVITAISSTPPTEPHVIEAPAPPVVAPAPKPAIRRIASRVSGPDPAYPREAIRSGVAKGRVLARVQVDEKGNVIDIQIISSEPPRVFDRAVRSALQEWKLTAEGEKYFGDVEINFTLKDE